MNDARFQALIDAYGADIERWPEEHRGPARRLLAEGGRAERALLKEAAALDALLVRGASVSETVPADLVGRIMQSYDPAVAATPRVWGWGAIALEALDLRTRLAAASLALVIAGGAAGWAASHDAFAAAAGDALFAAAYSDTAEDLFSVEGF